MLNYLENVSSYLPVERPNTGDANLAGDWHRRALQPSGISINGRSLNQDYQHARSSIARFDSREAIRAFLKAALIDKMAGLTPESRQLALDYLCATFHQGGLMNLGSAAFASSLVTGEREAFSQFAFCSDAHTACLEVTTSAKGLLISERVNVASLFDFRASNGSQAPSLIRPDGGKPYVAQLEVSLTLDFSTMKKYGDSPEIIARKNTISYGSVDFQRSYHPLVLTKELMEDYFSALPDWLAKTSVINEFKDTHTLSAHEHFIDKLNQLHATLTHAIEANHALPAEKKQLLQVKLALYLRAAHEEISAIKLAVSHEANAWLRDRIVLHKLSAKMYRIDALQVSLNGDAAEAQIERSCEKVQRLKNLVLPVIQPPAHKVKKQLATSAALAGGKAAAGGAALSTFGFFAAGGAALMCAGLKVKKSVATGNRKAICKALHEQNEQLGARELQLLQLRERQDDQQAVSEAQKLRCLGAS